MEPTVTKLVINNVLCLTYKEYYIAALAAGMLMGLGYEIGKERERKWLEKHMHTISQIVT